MEQLLSCQICTIEYTKSNQIFKFNCGHSSCQECSKAQKKCHVCNVEIEEIKLDEVRQKRRDFIDSYLNAKYVCDCGEYQQIKYYCFECNVLFCTECVFQHIKHSEKMKKVNSKQITDMIQQQIELFKLKIFEKQELLDLMSETAETKMITGQDILEMTQDIRDKFLSNEYKEDCLGKNIYDFSVSREKKKNHKLLGIHYTDYKKQEKSKDKLDMHTDYMQLLKLVQNKTKIVFRTGDKYLGILMNKRYDSSSSTSDPLCVFKCNFMQLKMPNCWFTFNGNDFRMSHGQGGGCHMTFNQKTGQILNGCFNCQPKTLFGNGIAVACGNSASFFGFDYFETIEVYDYV